MDLPSRPGSNDNLQLWISISKMFNCQECALNHPFFDFIKPIQKKCNSSASQQIVQRFFIYINIIAF
ncbi:hypothetical protein ASC83_11055 [Acidovorax sp. Root402]|nr:hypothetical protein ASC83_11055 [Acidovorax sp. Root402]